ncbi:MAG: DUF4838 domain-containing protein [Clostridia bacterium]|nr:DUF4838 domain-containing protein [Clostridia bacterium]
MKLTKNSGYRLLLPTDPTPRETFAAEELCRYLNRIFGMTPAEDGEISFLIGGPDRNPASAELISGKEFDALLTEPEGLCIKISGNRILLAGSQGKEDQERGTLYAVYEFLERHLGCTLAAYCAPDVDAGEIVPTLEELTLPDGQYIKPGADRPYRTAIVQYGDRAGDPIHPLNLSFFDWLCKNRYNRLLIWARIYEAWRKAGLVKELEKRGIRLSVGHHEASALWMPYYGNEYFPEHYVETHPEYFRLEADGSRFVPTEPNDPFGQWIFCSRNEAFLAEISGNILKWLAQNPQVDTITLWPNDGKREQCHCPRCSPYSKIENYTYVQNEIAKRVAAVYPHIKIDMLIYVDLWECPDKVSLAPNLFIDEATWAATLRNCGKPDGSCLIGTYFDENLLRWKRTGAQTVYYDYYMGVYGNRQRIIPMADELQSIWKDFVKKDIAGAGTQIECFNLWNHLMNLYTFGRTAYDTSLSFEDNLLALCRLFGEGAPFVAQAIRNMEQTLDGQVPIGEAGKYMIEHIDKAEVYTLFDRALAAATEKRSRNNIRLMRMAFRYSELETADAINRPTKEKVRYVAFREYDDPTGELAYMAQFDSFYQNDTGYGIAFPVTNTDTKDFEPDEWYRFE